MLKQKSNFFKNNLKFLGEELKYVDYEKLIIEDRELHKNLSNVSLKVAGLKKANTVYLHVVGRVRDKISAQVHEAREINKRVNKIERKMKNLLEKEAKILSDIENRQERINFVTDLTKRFTAPSVLDYVRHKDELYCTRQALKVVPNFLERFKMLVSGCRKKTRTLRNDCE